MTCEKVRQRRLKDLGFLLETRKAICNILDIKSISHYILQYQLKIYFMSRSTLIRSVHNNDLTDREVSLKTSKV